MDHLLVQSTTATRRRPDQHKLVRRQNHCVIVSIRRMIDNSKCNKCAKSDLGTGRVGAGCSQHQQWEVAFIHGCASCPSAAAAAVSAPRAATFYCVHLSFGRRIVTFLLICHNPRRWSWKRIYCQKAHESSLPTIGLLNGNVVKFSYIQIGNISPSAT